ncbi:MAG: ATP-binding protein [Pirellulales bacterium]
MFRLDRHMLLCFAAIFAPLAAVTALIVLAFYVSQNAAQRESRQANERDVVARQQQIVGGELRTIVADVMILSQLQTVRALLADASQPRRHTLADEYRLFVDHRQIYDQARFLDRHGMEVVRVNYRNGRGEIVAGDKLQEKGDRYYFQQAARLGPGQLYVSPFDLNVEDGVIERPAKPTIRFATPVFGDNGELGGVVILNYLGQSLLDKLRSASVGALGDVSLLNGDGYWLLGPSPDREWGFMVPDGKQISLSAEYPHAWRVVAAEDRGRFEADDGLWTYEEVRPFAWLPVGMGATSAASAEASTESGGRAIAVASDARGYAWKIVSHVPEAVISQQTTQLRQGFWRLFAALVLVLSIVSWLWTRVVLAHRIARRQLLQSERLSAIGEAMTALTHESRNALQRSQAGLDMLCKRVADRPEAVQLLGEVQQAQYFLRDQYESVRDYAAPMRLQCEAVDFRAVVRENWEQLAGQRQGWDVLLAQHDAAVDAAVDATVWADRRAVGQVVRNLLQNAIEASADASADVLADASVGASAGALRIEVCYREDRLDHRPALRIAIRDDGPGMSREQRLRAFEPFYTTKARGTGLGMAICRRIVEAHQGTISVGDGDGAGNRGGTEIIVVLARSKA